MLVVNGNTQNDDVLKVVGRRLGWGASGGGGAHPFVSVGGPPRISSHSTKAMFTICGNVPFRKNFCVHTILELSATHVKKFLLHPKFYSRKISECILLSVNNMKEKEEARKQNSKYQIHKNFQQKFYFFICSVKIIFYPINFVIIDIVATCFRYRWL